MFFKRHRSDDAAEAEPGRAALNSYPAKVRATMRAALVAVASAPPKRFAGGGYWEAMKGDKPFRTTLSDADYAAVRRLGDEYRSRNPRSLA